MPENRIIIEAGRSEKQYWRDLWRYRELLYFLAWRDILVRYKQTVVGMAWSIIQPLITLVVLTVIFGYLAKMPSKGVPYPLLVCPALLPWQFFSNAFNLSGNSLVGNANLITKVYFPRMVVPASSVVTSLVDFFISFFIMAAMFAYYRVLPGPNLMFLPLFMLLAFAAAMGFGLFVAALMAQYRDFRFILPFVTQIGMYISPVGFSTLSVPEIKHWHGLDLPVRLLYSLNPMVGVIDGFRWALLGGENALYMPGLGLSVLTTALLLLGGIWYFRKVERRFADVI